MFGAFACALLVLVSTGMFDCILIDVRSTSISIRSLFYSVRIGRARPTR